LSTVQITVSFCT